MTKLIRILVTFYYFINTGTLHNDIVFVISGLLNRKNIVDPPKKIYKSTCKSCQFSDQKSTFAYYLYMVVLNTYIDLLPNIILGRLSNKQLYQVNHARYDILCAGVGPIVTTTCSTLVFYKNIFVMPNFLFFTQHISEVFLILKIFPLLDRFKNIINFECLPDN